MFRLLAALFAFTLLLTSPAVTVGAIIVDSLASSPGVGVWGQVSTGGGSATLSNLTGLGGNLENNQPLPIGATHLTTGFDNADRAEIGIGGDFGSVQDIASFSYAYYKSFVPSGNIFAAPSLKLAILGTDPVFDFVTLVYEPTWNQPGNEGSSVAVPTGDWQQVSISQTLGLFWTTGGFGLPNDGGGPGNRTISQLIGEANSGFATARVVGISIGVGTSNQGQDGYFDDVNATFVDGFNETYNFEPSAVPEPSSFATVGVLATCLVMFCVRRRRNEATLRNKS